MERKFKIGDQVKFKIGTQSLFGEISEVLEGGCRISQRHVALRHKKLLPDCWVAYDCITELKKKRQPVNASRGISKNDIEGLIRLTMQDVFQRTMLEKKDYVIEDEIPKLYEQWKDNLK